MVAVDLLIVDVGITGYYYLFPWDKRSPFWEVVPIQVEVHQSFGANPSRPLEIRTSTFSQMARMYVYITRGLSPTRRLG